MFFASLPAHHHTRTAHHTISHNRGIHRGAQQPYTLFFVVVVCTGPPGLYRPGVRVEQELFRVPPADIFSYPSSRNFFSFSLQCSVPYDSLQPPALTTRWLSEAARDAGWCRCQQLSPCDVDEPPGCGEDPQQLHGEGLSARSAPALGMARFILAQEGVRGLWAGLSASL